MLQSKFLKTQDNYDSFQKKYYFYRLKYKTVKQYQREIDATKMSLAFFQEQNEILSEEINYLRQQDKAFEPQIQAINTFHREKKKSGKNKKRIRGQ